jgi:hypothetical protein
MHINFLKEVCIIKIQAFGLYVQLEIRRPKIGYL